MKFCIIYWIIGLILGYILIPQAAKDLKKEHEGYRDFFSRIVQDYGDNIIILIIPILIVSFIYPFILILALIDTIKKKGIKK
jgi:hypothetical protein